MSFVLAFGGNRAVGNNLPLNPYGSSGSAIVGTAPPAGSILFQDTNGFDIITLQEDVDSPTIERGIQCTAQHKFTCDYGVGIDLLSQLGMGTICIDADNLLWRVVTATIQSSASEKGNAAKLIVVSECLSFDVPPDKFQVNSVDLGIDIIKHPRYFPNLYPTSLELNTLTGQIKETIIRAIQTYRDSPFFPTASTLYGLINGQVQNIIAGGLGNGTFVITIPNPNYLPNFNFVPDLNIRDGSVAIVYTPPASITGGINDPNVPVSVNSSTVTTFYDPASVALAIAAAQEIITKLWRQEDSPYVPGVELKWTQYSFLPPQFCMGSFLENPILLVPDYFTQPDRPIYELPPRGGLTPTPAPDGDDIFTENAFLNPQDFSNDGTSDGTTEISWLRKADEVQWDRGLAEIVYTWVGSAIGFFDKQIYGATERPTQPSDYQGFS